MIIKDRLASDIKNAMRTKDKKKLGTLRLIAAAVKQVEVDERIIVEPQRMLVILDKLVKQRKESIAQYQTAKRDDLVAQEQYELDIINDYLPQPLTESEVVKLIDEAIVTLDAKHISDMRTVMAQLKPLLQGRADMSKVSELIKAKLS